MTILFDPLKRRAKFSRSDIRNRAGHLFDCVQAAIDSGADSVSTIMLSVQAAYGAAGCCDPLFHVDSYGVLHYPGEPPAYPLIQFTVHGVLIRIYDDALVSVKSDKEQVTLYLPQHHWITRITCCNPQQDALQVN